LSESIKLKYIQKHVIFPGTLGINSTKKERESNGRYVTKANFLKINKLGVQIRAGGWKKSKH